MLKRQKEIRILQSLLSRYPIVGLVGARQVGKTTLARMLRSEIKEKSSYFDLEDPGDLARLADPMLALKGLQGLVILDEVQRKPDLFPVLRVLADRPKRTAKFLILGSASPDMVHRSAETLAGRIAYHELPGFSVEEVGEQHSQKLWVRGGFPPAYLASTYAASFDWRLEFIRTFLERDLPQLGVMIRSTSLRRFWSMLAHYHGQVWNSSEFARSFGVADTTVRNYLDLLTGALVIRQLLPWSENVAKRQVKSPKVYVADSGLLHALLGLRTVAEIESHPKLGASWEGFVISQVVRHIGARPEECFFWATHGGAELDLLVVRGQRRFGFEIKRTVEPRLTSSMRSALTDLRLNHLYIVHSGEKGFPVAKAATAIPFLHLMDELRPL